MYLRLTAALKLVALLAFLTSLLFSQAAVSQPVSRTIFETHGSVYPGAWADNGETFYATLHLDDRWTILAIDVRSGNAATVDVPLANSGISDVFGSKLLLEAPIGGQYDIFVYDLATQELTRVTQTPANEWHPAFGATADTIVHDSDAGGVLNLYLRKISTDTTTQVTDDPSSEQTGRLSPDAKKIAFHRHMGGGNYDIFTRDIENQTETRITFSDGDDSYPRWVLNGRGFLYSSNRTGQFEIYGQCLGSLGSKRLTHSEGNKKYPKVSPDGRWIAVQVQEAGRSRIDVFEASNLMACPSSSQTLISALEAGEIVSVNGLAISHDFRHVYATTWSGASGERRAKLVRYQYQGNSWRLVGDVFPVSAYQDYQPVLSLDQETLYFTSTRPVDETDNPSRQNIWHSKKSPAGEWLSPEVIVGLISPKWDGHAVPAADGSLYFASEREGGAGMVDIFKASATDNHDEVENLEAVNSPMSESDFYLDPHERFIIFSRYNPGSHDLNLFYAVNSDEGWSSPFPIADVNTDQWELSPVVTPDHEYLIYIQGQEGRFQSVPLCSVFREEKVAGLGCG